MLFCKIYIFFKILFYVAYFGVHKVAMDKSNILLVPLILENSIALVVSGS